MTAVAEHAPATNAAPGVPFERLLKVEWRKLTDTRAAQWLIGIVAVIGLLTLVAAVVFDGEFDQTTVQFVQIVGFTTSILFPVVVILHFTSEFNQRSALFTFTQEPNRLKVLAAKLLVGVWLAVVFSIALRLAITAGLGVSALLGRDPEFSSLAAQAQLTGFLVLNALLATAFAVLLQSSAPAIVLFYIVPTVWSALVQIPAIEKVGPYLDTSQSWGHVIEGSMSGQWLHLVTSTLFWVVVPLLVGGYRLVSREIK